MEEIFAQYYEDLLRAQYKVSEIIHQTLPRGTIREDFLRNLVLIRKESMRGKKGIITKNGSQSGECDLIFYNVSATVTPLGDQIMIEPTHCKLALEIKSNATGEDLKKTNKNFEKIKELDSVCNPLCGLFCYNTALEKKTILNRFGFSYDSELDSWSENETLSLHYPSIDFIISIACLEEDDTCIEKQFFLIKDTDSGKFILQLEYPIIKNFFGITDNL